MLLEPDADGWGKDGRVIQNGKVLPTQFVFVVRRLTLFFNPYYLRLAILQFDQEVDLFGIFLEIAKTETLLVRCGL